MNPQPQQDLVEITTSHGRAGGATRERGCDLPLLTLTIEEIRDLAGMCGLVVKDALDKEKEDERETEITITPWPTAGIKDENGKPYAHAHKHLAYFEEYPEEGCVPLGSPNETPESK